MFDAPAIIVRFDRRKINSSAYGLTCWKRFWAAVDPKGLFAVNLFEGDSPGTLNGTEDVYCLGFQTLIPEMIDAIRSGLNTNPDVQALLALPSFVEGSAAEALLFDVLPESGMVNAGHVEGGSEARNPRSALPS